MSQTTVTLRGGLKMPQIGIGTYQMNGDQAL